MLNNIVLSTHKQLHLNFSDKKSLLRWLNSNKLPISIPYHDEINCLFFSIIFFGNSLSCFFSIFSLVSHWRLFLTFVFLSELSLGLVLILLLFGSPNSGDLMKVLWSKELTWNISGMGLQGSNRYGFHPGPSKNLSGCWH